MKLYEYLKMSPEQREHIEAKKELQKVRQAHEQRQKEDSDRAFQYEVSKLMRTEHVKVEMPKAIKEVYDERFCRMWEFYLAGAEVSFRRHFMMVWQMQLARDVSAVPLRRDYIVDWERAHPAAAAERAA